MQCILESVHSRAAHHLRGAHAWAGGHNHARWGPSRRHGMLLRPIHHPRPAIQGDQCILLREALRTSVKRMLEVAVRLLMLPAILQHATPS